MLHDLSKFHCTSQTFLLVSLQLSLRLITKDRNTQGPCLQHLPTTFTRLGLSDLDLSGRIHQVTCITADLSKNDTYNHNMTTRLKASSADSVSDLARYGHFTVKNVDSEHCKVRDVLFVACSVFQHFSSSTSPRMSRKPSTRLRRLLLATFFWRPSGALFLLLSSS